MIPSNFNSSFSCVKLILPAGSTEVRIISNILIENYNFLNYTDFFKDFALLTSSFSKFNILFRVFLFVPDSKSDSPNYFFFIKNINSKYLFLNFLFINSLICNNSKKNNIYNFKIKFDNILLYKIVLILSFFININIGNFKNLLFLKVFKLNLKMFINYIYSFQFLYFFIDNNFICLNRRYFHYFFEII